MKIQILGTGCAKCNNLTEATKKAADEMGLDYELEKVTDIKEILKMGVISTPAIAVNGSVKVSGKVPSIDDIKKLLK